MSTYNREDYSFEAVPGQWFTWKDHQSGTFAYENCPPLSAIINRKAQAYITGKTYVMKTEGKGKDKESKSAEAEKFRKLWAKPNALHTGKEFRSLIYIQKELHGWCVIHCVKPVGKKDNIDAFALWVYSPRDLDIKFTGKQFGQNDIRQIIESVTLVQGSKRTVLDMNDLIFIRDFTPSCNNYVFPISKLKACQLPINNIIGAYESRYNIMNSRGPQFVVSSNRSDQNGRHPMLPAEKEDLQNAFKKGYGTRNGQSNAIITKAPIDLKTVGFTTKDMELMEEVKDSTIALCNSLGIAPELFGVEQGKFANVSEAGKALFNNTIKPDADIIAEQIQQGFFPFGSGIRLEEDYAHVPELQEDKLQNARSRKVNDQAYLIEWQNDLITLNMWLVANGEDAKATEGDIYYSDWVKIHPELATVQNQPTAANDSEDDTANPTDGQE